MIINVNRNENQQAIYSSLQQEKKTNSLVANKSMSKYKHSKKVSQIKLCLIILALLLLVLISLVTSIVISFVMKTNTDGDNQGNYNLSVTSPNEDFMNILKHNTKRISAIEKELKEYRKSDLFSINFY